ncbi:MAG: response regulator [Brasilonema octagenarum HA4186-MV1]|uniref:histidine kinase n=2 Tax=Brasilonema TaxID=383614 RepID=A0A856ML31_9CYAN|nr:MULTISPECIES: hybrid sensor histidine kinase/response regulator [Brasilonema]MBW4625469.1 response regulator [Brasilonema octagenarum HA4186-MV1]NMF66039.1 hybrid sensor histidine kinase/response regulator [Brasilonema octagenarum UFV-OR1]QDL12093.1 hybrid sensor histidine kinase/response regulator [Brasilonema sennae CENA114]QDL18469.1 hybrid sensor histidine kinase/response regulator [Brasilonema octagenarum UFV-E1]
MLAQDNSQVEYILAVDDNPDNLILLETILESEGYKVELISNGMHALEQIAQDPPDLILLDVMMPEMDGYEVTRRIRQNREISYIPILLITAYHDASVVEGLDAGADDFIRKPFDHEELLARVRSMLRLKHSIDEQRKMARQREDFVSRLTHDLRTPLVAADRMLHLFHQELFCAISPDMKEAIFAMIRSNQNLLEMVNNLLEVYRFEAGKKNLQLETCNLRQIVEEIVQELTPLVLEKGLTINIDSSNLDQKDETAGVVKGDRSELRRVTANLVGNAIKFTDTGSVNIRVSETPVGPEGNTWVIIEVQDTGFGIAPEDQATIFERFRQGKNKRAGSGLGLHLSQRIIESHKGTIDVFSELGKGSLFTVRLPK